jgi:peptide/nickel transport system substrate-binding protein
MEGSADAEPKKAGGSKIIAIFIVGLLVGAALGAGIMMVLGGGEDEETAYKTVVVATIDGNPESLDPAVDYETVGGEIIQNVYETLMFYDGNSTDVLVPQLCTEVPTLENGLVTGDGFVYTYNLRKGVTFHDGTEMTSEDVFYSFARVLRLNDPHGPAWMIGELLIPDYYNYSSGKFLANGNLNESSGIPMDQIRAHIWAKDDYTVQFNLSVAFPGWNYVITFGVGSIVSKDYVEANGGMKKTGYDHMFAHMCGTGAFSLEEYSPDSQFVLLRYDDYWKGPAKINRVIIMQVPDANTRLLLLKSGQVDIAAIPRTLRDSVVDDTNIEIIEGFPTFNIDFIGLNQNINFNTTASRNTDVPANFFADKNVRLAFAHAMNASKLIETQFNGAGIQPNGAIPKGMFGYDPDIPVYTYDLEKVKSYLKNASNGEGSNYLDEGFSIDIFYNTGNTVRQAACQMFKAGLEAANPSKIHVTVNGVEWATYLQLREEGAMPVLFLGWAPDYADPNNYMQPFFHSAGTYASMIGYSNATVDDLIEEAAAEMNKTRRAELYSELSLLMYEECVHIWTVQATNFHCERAWLDGYVFNPMYSGFYYYPMDK